MAVDNAARDATAPWLFRLLGRAAQFADVLAHHLPSNENKVDVDAVDVLGSELVTLAPAAALDRLVRLRAASCLRRKDPGLAGDSASLSSDTDDAHPEYSIPSEDVEVSPSSRPAMIETLPPPLSPAEQLELIISEFGVLAKEGEEERLLLETDGSFFQEVIILGVIHLTTHRLTFHASLPAPSDSDRNPTEILHAGAVTVRTRSLRRRKRVWLELTQDMLTSFPSSDPLARMRPLYTILLSSFRKIHPIDCRRRRFIRVSFLSGPAPTRRFYLTPSRTTTTSRSSDHEHPEEERDVTTEELEFSTEEAALAWRQALHAALYMYRRRRRDVLEGGKSGDVLFADGSGFVLRRDERQRDEGVRINVPLANIAGRVVDVWKGIGNVLQIDLDSTSPTSTSTVTATSIKTPHRSNTFPTTTWIKSSPLSVGWTSARSDSPQTTTLRFVLLHQDAALDALPSLIDARKREGAKGARVTVELGGLAEREVIEGMKGSEGETRREEEEVRRLFGLGAESAMWMTKCTLTRPSPSIRPATPALLIASPPFVCIFARQLFVPDVKLRFHAEDVRADPVGENSTGLVLRVRGVRDVLLEFGDGEARDNALAQLRALSPSRIPSSLRLIPHSLSRSSTRTTTDILSPPSRTLSALLHATFPTPLLPHISPPINAPSLPFGLSPQHFVLLTIGSRGDVQPYIALAMGLQAVGHRVTIVTHDEYEKWVKSFGVGWRGAGGDPGRLMKLSVEHRMFSPQFFKESIGNFRTWIDELLIDAWEACKDADVLIESPPAMAGVHIAEALGIPYFRAFTMPWTKTAQFAHPFMTPPVPVEGSRFNAASYVLFDNVFWLGTSGQINKWRKKHLGLPPTDMGHLAQAKIPFLYNFSPSVVPKPLDWGDHIGVTGYWFLDNPDPAWTPPPALVAFIRRARADVKPLVYIGFGSITVPRAKAMTRSIVKAVARSGVRAVLSKGWSSRMDEDDGDEVALPPEIYGVDSVPHDWLFPQMDAALHHGGAGTTGASLRAGIPTLIKPWFGDQFFWASRVQKLGAGLRVPSLRSADLADALKSATTDRVMREKAAQVGERIVKEDGVSTAIKAIYTYMHRAGSHRSGNLGSAMLC